MEKLEELTEVQEQAADALATQYELLALGGNDAYSVPAIQAGIKFLYALIKLPTPDIVICPSPLDLVRAAKLKKGETIDCLGLNYDCGWTAFYAFFQDALGIVYDNCGFAEWRQFIDHSGVWATVFYEHVAFVCIRPCTVQRDTNDELHCETGPAIGWQDGYHEYFLHGVSVPPELVQVTAQALDVHRWVAQEPNAEIRREAVRKIGIERVCEALHAERIERSDDEVYELLSLDIGGGQRRPYLKMRNPSLGVYHIEGVHPDCRSIQEALNWRAGDITKPWKPEVLT